MTRPSASNSATEWYGRALTIGESSVVVPGVDAGGLRVAVVAAAGAEGVVRHRAACAPGAAAGEVRGAPAQLYRSTDGGQTWLPPRPSGSRGPRYRCLAYRDGLLHACAGGTPNGDDFLLGTSGDDGASWSPVMTVEALVGPEPCHRASCATTEAWLCAVHDRCDGVSVPPSRPDAGTAPPAPGGGRSCTSGGPGGPGHARGALAPLLLALSAVARRKRHLHTPSGAAEHRTARPETPHPHPLPASRGGGERLASCLNLRPSEGILGADLTRIFWLPTAVRPRPAAAGRRRGEGSPAWASPASGPGWGARTCRARARGDGD